jgi:hypothetical protein
VDLELLTRQRQFFNYTFHVVFILMKHLDPDGYDPSDPIYNLPKPVLRPPLHVGPKGDGMRRRRGSRVVLPALALPRR